MLKEVQSRNGICDSLGLLFLEDEACIRLSTIRCCTWFLLKGFLNEVEIGASSLVPLLLGTCNWIILWQTCQV